MIAAQPPARDGVQRELLVEDLGLERPALGQVLVLAAELVEVVGLEARVDLLRELLQHPHGRAVRLAEQVDGLARVPDPVGVAVDQRG